MKVTHNKANSADAKSRAADQQGSLHKDEN
jgi:hypothetical protein